MSSTSGASFDPDDLNIRGYVLPTPVRVLYLFTFTSVRLFGPVFLRFRFGGFG